MEITGTITKVLPVESGVSTSTGNEWKRQTVVITPEDRYPKPIAVILSNQLVESIAVGEDLTLFINISSREYQGRYYTSVEAWKVQRNQPQPQPQQQPYPQTAQQPYPQPQQQYQAPAPAPQPQYQQPQPQPQGQPQTQYQQPYPQPQGQPAPAPGQPRPTAPYVPPVANEFAPQDGDLPF